MKKDNKPQEQKPQENLKKEELKEEKKHIKNDKNFLKVIKRVAGR